MILKQLSINYKSKRGNNKKYTKCLLGTSVVPNSSLLGTSVVPNSSLFGTILSRNRITFRYGSEGKFRINWREIIDCVSLLKAHLWRGSLKGFSPAGHWPQSEGRPLAGHWPQSEGRLCMFLGPDIGHSYSQRGDSWMSQSCNYGSNFALEITPWTGQIACSNRNGHSIKWPVILYKDQLITLTVFRGGGSLIHW